MKFLIKQEYSRRVFLIKFVFVPGSGEGRYTELRNETGFLFRLSSPTHSSIISSQKRGAMYFFPLVSCCFCPSQLAVCCVVFQFKLTKNAKHFRELRCDALN